MDADGVHGGSGGFGVAMASAVVCCVDDYRGGRRCHRFELRDPQRLFSEGNVRACQRRPQSAACGRSVRSPVRDWLHHRAVAGSTRRLSWRGAPGGHGRHVDIAAGSSGLVRYAAALARSGNGACRSSIFPAGQRTVSDTGDPLHYRRDRVDTASGSCAQASHELAFGRSRVDNALPRPGSSPFHDDQSAGSCCPHLRGQLVGAHPGRPPPLERCADR